MSGYQRLAIHTIVSQIQAIKSDLQFLATEEISSKELLALVSACNALEKVANNLTTLNKSDLPAWLR